MKKLLRLLLLATAALVGGASSATAQVFELQCPIGFHPFPNHTMFDNSTGQYRNWLCYDDNGNVQLSAVGSSTAFSAITSGTNTAAAMIIDSGASLQPLNFGRNISTSQWLYPTDPLPSTGIPTANMTAAHTGALTASHNIDVVFTFTDGTRETTPSGETGKQCLAGANDCSITAIAPSPIPTPFTGYTLYARDVSSAQSLQKIAGCVNITTNCAITAIPTTSAPPATNAVLPLPSLAKASVCPPNVTPISWVPDANGNLNSEEYISEYYDTNATGGGPVNPSDTGVLVGCRPRWYTDMQLDPPGGKNAFFLIDHQHGNSGIHPGNQDRALWLLSQTPTNDAATRYGIETIQSEMDFNCNGCTINGSPDSEVTSGSFQLTTAGASTNWTTTGYQTNAIQGRVFRNGAGFDIAGINGIYSNVANGNVTAPAGAFLSAFQGIIGGTANAPAIRAVGLRLTGSGATGRFGINNGIFSSALFTPSNAGTFGGNADAFIDQRTHNWHSYLNGGVGLTSIENTDGSTQSLPLNASVNLTGALATLQIASSWTPGYSASCGGGASTYTYTLVAVDVNGGQSISATFNCITGANPLTVPNPVTLNPGGIVTTSAVYRQATRIDVYRTGGPMATGKIGSLSCNSDLPIFSCNAFVDSGLGVGAALPSLNTTGSNNAYLFGTTTNCSATGSAASPSVAACGAASAGSFSCATNAVNTCTVNTTAVTTNSEIFISQREDATTGTRLGVTCNVTPSVVIADQNITAVVAGTSFSFSLTQPVTNPDCFSYLIINQ